MEVVYALSEVDENIFSKINLMDPTSHCKLDRYLIDLLIGSYDVAKDNRAYVNTFVFNKYTPADIMIGIIRGEILPELKVKIGDNWVRYIGNRITNAYTKVPSDEQGGLIGSHEVMEIDDSNIPAIDLDVIRELLNMGYKLDPNFTGDRSNIVALLSDNPIDDLDGELQLES